MIEQDGTDEERRQVIAEFYRVYRPIQKRHSLRMHSRFSIFEKEGLIEIWEFHGETKGRRICYVKEESEIGCYKRAIGDLQSYAASREGGYNAQGSKYMAAAAGQ